MSVNVAELNFKIFLGLGQPDKSVCDLADINNAVRKALSLVTGQARRSDNNQLLSVTNELSSASTPALGNPYDVTEEIENCTPAWVEMLEGSEWKTLDVVNKSQLALKRSRQQNACSFYGLDRDGEVTQYIEFSFAPERETIRIWFDQDAVATDLDNTALFPDNLTVLIEYMAMNEVIMVMQTRIAQQIESEETRLLMNVRLTTLDKLYAHNLTQIEAWKREFRLWKNRTRGAQSARHLKPRRNRGFYG